MVEIPAQAAGGATASSNNPALVPPKISWWARYSRWRQTSQQEAAHDEQKLLSLLGTSLEVTNVDLGPTAEHFLHCISAGDRSLTPVVFLPGYGAGSGFWFRNFKGLSAYMHVLALDWLGTGLSGRPPFVAKSREDSENFFLEPLDAWRQKMGYEKMVLVGHSLGGYLAATYAMKYPERVQHLVLVCPAGLTSKPVDWEENFQLKTGWRSTLYSTFTWMWERGVTPGGFIRALGPFGPQMIGRYVQGRFRAHDVEQTMDEEQLKQFESYFYHISAAKGSGEYALRHILAPFAWARSPLEQRLKDNLKMPVTFIYGKYDWMDASSGKRVVEHLAALHPPGTPGRPAFEIIPRAGHFPFVDQPAVFDDSLISHLKYLLKPARGPVNSSANITAETVGLPVHEQAAGSLDTMQ